MDFRSDELMMDVAVAEKVVDLRVLVDDGTTKISAVKETVPCKSGQHIGTTVSHKCAVDWTWTYESWPRTLRSLEEHSWRAAAGAGRRSKDVT